MSAHDERAKLAGHDRPGASYRVEHAVQSDPESPFVWQPMPYAVILEHDTRAAAERELNEHIACGRDPNRLRVREVA